MGQKEKTLIEFDTRDTKPDLRALLLLAAVMAGRAGSWKKERP